VAIDKSDPFPALARRSMFASAGASPRLPAVLTPKPKVVTPSKPVLTPKKPTVPELVSLTERAVAQKGNRLIGVRLPPDLLARLTIWAKAHEALSLPDAIRRLVEDGLATR
jgi:hypothetical protein